MNTTRISMAVVIAGISTTCIADDFRTWKDVTGKATKATLETTGETPSGYVQRLISADLGVPPPLMVAGNPNLDAESARAAARARWSKHRLLGE